MTIVVSHNKKHGILCIIRNTFVFVDCISILPDISHLFLFSLHEVTSHVCKIVRQLSMAYTVLRSDMGY